MEEKRKILDRILNQPIPVQVWAAEVTAIDGLTCTVVLTNTELEVDGVALVANPDADEYFALFPKVGSRVLVGLKENEIADLYILQVTEVDSIRYKSSKVDVTFGTDSVAIKNDKANILVDAAKVTLVSNQTTIVMDDKVEIKNAGASLKDLFSELITLLNSFSVLTSVGPSAGLNPATMTLLTQLQVKTNLLLK